MVEGGEVGVYIDIKPGSCPNPLNPKAKGVLPVAVLGTADFDVTTIDPSTLSLTRAGVTGSVAPIRWSYADVGTPFMGDGCDCHDLTGDGYMDLTLKFSDQGAGDGARPGLGQGPDDRVGSERYAVGRHAAQRRRLRKGAGQGLG